MNQANIDTTLAASRAMKEKLDKFSDELLREGCDPFAASSAHNLGLVRGQVEAARDALTNAKISIEVYLSEG